MGKTKAQKGSRKASKIGSKGHQKDPKMTLDRPRNGPKSPYFCPILDPRQPKNSVRTGCRAIGPPRGWILQSLVAKKIEKNRERKIKVFGKSQKNPKKIKNIKFSLGGVDGASKAPKMVKGALKNGPKRGRTCQKRTGNQVGMGSKMAQKGSKKGQKGPKTVQKSSSPS